MLMNVALRMAGHDGCRQQRPGGLLQAPVGNALHGITLGEHLSLLGNLNPPADGLGRLGQNAAVQRHPATPQGAAAAMEKLQLHGEGPGRLCEVLQGQAQLPVSGEHTSVLIAVGVAQHNLLLVVGAGYRLPVSGNGEQGGHNRRRIMEIVDSLEQRHRLQRTGQIAFLIPAVQPDLLAEHHHLQQVTGALGHADQIAPDAIDAEFLLGSLDRTVHVQAFRRGFRIVEIGRCNGTRIVQHIRQKSDLLLLGQLPVIVG
ncbi:hypothetical protein D3C75_762320 [compost metagenome]